MKGDATPEKPTCKSGFRNQCVDEATVGSQFGCALLGDRTVWCWGRNDQGQLGYATTDLCPEDIGGGKTRAVACHTFPFQVNGLEDVRAIASGDAFSCAIVGETGAVQCWGGNAHGELGNGKNITSQTPVAVSGLAKTTRIALGRNHACALSDGHVMCWGANDHGQLGSDTKTTCKIDSSDVACATTPISVPFVTDVEALTAGAEHTCALLKNHTVTCWGDNHWGQLGTGTTGQPVEQPVEDAGADASSSDASADAGPTKGASVLVGLSEPLSYVSSISSGAYHTCALREGGDVYCWGRDDHHELGGPAPASGAIKCDGPCFALAVKVPDLPPTVEAPVDAGAEDASVDAPASSDATTSKDSSSDASADTSVADSAVDAPAPTGGTFGRDLTSGDSFSCLRIADGTVRCWGIDTVGQLGDGKSSTDPHGPTLVIAAPGVAKNNPLQGVATVSAGALSACAVMADHSLRCWGSNQNGALGVGHFTPQQGPVPVSW